ncbi:DUF4834 family protein [Flavobacterium ardleyense]|uniref:DUF4834 family protein n=1 Tax=Flavobacterium ardleyense TaxID=2038737 RepID=UPI00298D27B1|nr:DUF4834 domain-containing protein [Flavobacterium ardleyense]
MQTASIQGVVKILFYFIIFYYVAKFVMRFLAPILLRKAMEKAQESFRQQQQPQQPRESQTTFESPTSDRPKEKTKVGEYIDFEEIK